MVFRIIAISSIVGLVGYFSGGLEFLGIIVAIACATGCVVRAIEENAPKG